MNRPGWAIELLGEAFDIADWRSFLPFPFDPWVEIISGTDNKAVLRSCKWDGVNSHETVVHDAQRIVDLVSGAVLIAQADSLPVKLGSIMRFNDNGERENTVYPAAAVLGFAIGSFRIRGRATLSGGAPALEESRVQRWVAASEANDDRAFLLKSLPNCDNWFDIYKAIELAMRIGGTPAKLLLVSSGRSGDWNDLKQTANHYRHAPDTPKYPLPKSPPTLEAARNMLIEMISLSLQP